MNEWEKLHEAATRYKKMYPKGTRIELLSMANDPRPVASGTRGTVQLVDDIGQLQVVFDNGLAIGVVPGEDSDNLDYVMTANRDLSSKIHAMKQKLREKKNFS